MAGTEALHWRAGPLPARMSSDSALRRMRVARWSRRNSSSRDSGSASFSSISLMYSSCLVTRFWLRRPRLTKASARLRRRLAWPAASSTAVLLTASRAWAMRPTSSWLWTRTLGTLGGSPPVRPESRMAWTVAGRVVLASSSAWWARSTSGRDTDRLTRMTRARPMAMPRAPRPPKSRACWTALLCRAEARLCTTAAIWLLPRACDGMALLAGTPGAFSVRAARTDTRGGVWPCWIRPRSSCRAAATALWDCTPWETPLSRVLIAVA